MTAPVVTSPITVLDTKIGDRTIKGADVDSLINAAATALVAAGTTRADALALTARVNHIATAAASTGAVLPAMTLNEIVTVFNDGANPIKVYAPGSVTIDGTAGATGVTLTNAKRAAFQLIAANTVVSWQLGVPSA